MTELSRIAGSAFAVLCAYVLFNFLQRQITRRKWTKQYGCANPPRYPHKDPIGLDLFLLTIRNVKNFRMLEGWKERFQKYGTTFSGTSMGVPSIYTVNPQNLQSVHALNFAYYGVQPIRRAATLPFLGEGVFTMDGPFWDHSRALIRPTFTRANVANLPAFEVHFQRFLRLLPKDGDTVDLKPLLYRLFLDTASEFLFGESIDALSDETPFKTQEFLDAFHYAQKGMGTRIQMRSLKFLFRDKKWWEAIKISHDFAYTYVDKALAFRKRYLESKVLEKVSEPEDDEKHRYVLLEEMAKETDDRDYLRSQIVHIFIAGHDSTAITVGHVFFLLSRHPEVYEKLHAEVNALDEAFTFESLKSMHYLQYVIKETLRLHPVTPLDSRIAMQDTILPTGGGPNGDSPIFVPKDSLVTTSLHSLHRLSPVFQPDPDSFRPERWETVRPGWNYLPFFGGPRICPGRQLALTEAAYVVARMVQEFRRMECRDPVKEWVEEFKITASSRNGTKVALFKD